MNKKTQSFRKIVSTNRKAFQNYYIIEKYEAGIALLGTEVKSLREGNADLTAAFADISNGKTVILYDLHIKPYSYANQFNHDPKRERQLLLHKKEIKKLIGKLSQKGFTLIPLSLYFNPKGIAKVELALCKGKSFEDKRETLRRKNDEKEARRIVTFFKR
jgi:SsrA-binding protein